MPDAAIVGWTSRGSGRDGNAGWFGDGSASASHSVEVEDTATLLAKGAGVIVPVTVQWEPAPFPYPGADTVTVSLTQRSGNRIAESTGTAAFTCTGSPQTVDVLLTAGDVPFKHGAALVTVRMLDCQDFMTCHTVTDTEEIRLAK